MAYAIDKLYGDTLDTSHISCLWGHTFDQHHTDIMLVEAGEVGRQ